MTNLKDKVAIVTGGASGIGLGTVKAFAEKGAKVVIADINEKTGKEKEEELKGKGLEVMFVKVDASKEESVKELVDTTVSHYGTLDIMVNNAGMGEKTEMHELTDEEYKKIIGVNQNGVFYGMKHAINHFLTSGGGVVLSTSSILGKVGEPIAFAYSATKGAVVQMTKSAALKYADKNIRVNAVGPGYIETPLVSKEALGDFYDGLVAKHPIGRLGTPEEVGHAMVFLAENDFVTGTTLMVDGGYTAQ